MPIGHGRLSFACALAVLEPTAAAQDRADVTAQPTFARVESSTGEPLADAVVTFAGCLPHVGTDAGPLDVQQVQSDAKGRARARLQPNLCYVAWAVGPADGEGRCAVTPVRGWFGAGAVLTLRCDAPQPPRRLAVDGLAAWAKEGPLQFVAQTPVPGTETELRLGDDGRLPVPPGPHDVIEVRTAAGEPLWHAMTAKHVIALPPPQSVRVRVVDEDGAPLPGAVVRHRVGRQRQWRLDNLGGAVGHRWRSLGTTDQGGHCSVEVPYATDPLRSQAHDELLLFASVPGRPAVAGGLVNRALYADDRKIAKAEGGELVFTCRKVEPLSGRVAGLPLGTVAQLCVTGKLMSDGTSYTHDPRSIHVPVGPDGTFAFVDVPSAVHACRLAFVFPADSPRASPLFQAQPGRELPPEVTAGGGVLSADAFANVQLRVTDHGGGPARGLVALVVPHAESGLQARDSALRVPLDARGSATLTVTLGNWVVMVASDSGWGAQSVDLGPGDNEVAVAMQPMATMRVELRDDAGLPLAGARVVVRGSTQRGTNDPLQNVLPALRVQMGEQWARLRTDDAGRITIPFVPLATQTQRLGLVWKGGASAEFELEANVDWHTVRPK